MKRIEYHRLCCSTQKNKTVCHLRFDKGCPKNSKLHFHLGKFRYFKKAHFTS